MMMAKAPTARYQSCSDLLVDLRAVRNKQLPPIAHKDLGGLDLQSLASAEASAPSAPMSHSATEPRVSVRPWLFKALLITLGLSLLGNLLLAVLR